MKEFLSIMFLELLLVLRRKCRLCTCGKFRVLSTKYYNIHGKRINMRHGINWGHGTNDNLLLQKYILYVVKDYSINQKFYMLYESAFPPHDIYHDFNCSDDFGGKYLKVDLIENDSFLPVSITSKMNSLIHFPPEFTLEKLLNDLPNIFFDIIDRQFNPKSTYRLHKIILN